MKLNLDKITGIGYRNFLKPILFLKDPEVVHDKMVVMGRWLGGHSFGRAVIGGLFGYQDPILSQDILGISFKNPIGLSAGFDKNAELTDILPSVGFGFSEVGSVTGDPCDGNPKPRLWRLKKSKSIAVHYGLKSDGCEEVSRRLQGKKFQIPIGISVAMTNCQKNLVLENSIADFAKAFLVMEPVANYITVNISCPNALGGQPFSDPRNLDNLFCVLDKIPTTKPVFIKLSPDLSNQELDAILDVARSHRIDGIVCANLTKNRNNSKIFDKVPDVGSLSGKPVEDLSNKMLSYIYKKEGKRFVLVASGGVFSAEDAYKKIRLGASLIQVITGMIFEGPQLIGEINRGLAKMLKRDGFSNISQAVGSGISTEV